METSVRIILDEAMGKRARKQAYLMGMSLDQFVSHMLRETLRTGVGDIQSPSIAVDKNQSSVPSDSNRTQAMKRALAPLPAPKGGADDSRDSMYN